MKKALFILCITVLTVSSAIAQEINWVSFEEAVALQKKTPKKIMMDMYTVWCGPCKMLDKNTFQNKDVVAYVNKNYYAVKFNAEGNEVVSFKGATFENPNYDQAKAKRRNSSHELSRHFSVQAYPTLVFLDESADFIAPIRGYKTPQQLELYLKMFGDDSHKGMDTEAFNVYFKAFKPEFSQK
jgi:thioredoxin-related protein